MLITNDNGIKDIKIIELAKAFAKISETYVVAPMENRSGTSHFLTVIQKGEIKIKQCNIGEGIHAYAVDGYPADCIIVGLAGLMRENSPDLVISGINGGPNLGINWLFSGTIGAARIATFAGFPSIAISGLDDDMPSAMEAATQWIVQLAQNPIVPQLQSLQYLTVSIPRILPSEIKGIKVAKRESAVKTPVFRKTSGDSIHNRTEIWRLEGFEESESPILIDSDTAIYEAGYIVVVPMIADEHDYKFLYDLKMKINQFPVWRIK